LARQQPEPPIATAAAVAPTATPTTPTTNAPAAPADPVAAAIAQTAAAPKYDPSFEQCTTEADCTLVEDGCTTLGAVNKQSVAGWKAVMVHYPECKPFYDLAKVSLTLKATCRYGECVVQDRSAP
jgi:hypothetical protein